MSIFCLGQREPIIAFSFKVRLRTEAHQDCLSIINNKKILFCLFDLSETSKEACELLDSISTLWRSS